MSALAGAGRHFDGVSAQPVPVSLRLADGRLEVLAPGLRRDWNCLDLRADEAGAPTMRVGPAGATERVEVSDRAFAGALDRACADLYARPAGEGGTLRLVAWSAAAGGVLLALAAFGVPALAGVLAPLVPRVVESRLAVAAEAQLGHLLGDPPACAAPAGRAALDRLAAALGSDLPAAPRVSVRRTATANALTLPGERVVVLSGLIAKARTPDEFAGVLAYEFGHVAARDPTRALIQASGTAFLLGYVLGDLTGSTVIVALGQTLLSAGYSRDAERAADAYAVAAVSRAGGDGAALAAILERIAADDGGAPDLLRSHPLTRERAAAIRALAAAAPKPGGRSIMAAQDWAALRAICPSAPVEPGAERVR